MKGGESRGPCGGLQIGVGGRITFGVDWAMLLDFWSDLVESDAPREEHEEGEEGEEDLVFSPLRGQLHEHAHDEAQVGGAGCVCVCVHHVCV